MCHDDLDSKWEADLGKMVFGRHRRFLPVGHSMRYETDHWFGKVELEQAPTWPTGDDWLNRWNEVEDRVIVQGLSGMRRLSTWNELPYWKVRNVEIKLWRLIATPFSMWHATIDGNFCTFRIC
jgi:hypothetical protein